MDLKDQATLESIADNVIRSSVPRPLKTLYQGEPMALGITQILIGILEISFGLVVAITESPPTSNAHEGHLTNAYWMGIVYIISGSLSVAAAKNPKVPLVKGMLAMNVVSSVAAGIAIVILSIYIAHPIYYTTCFPFYHTIDTCHGYATVSNNIMYGVLAILLVATILEFFITIITAAFGCASVCRNYYPEKTVVIFQQTGEGTASASALPRQMNEDMEA
ncbi:membrane-spanning 4-domains subfamily A member 15-like isoform X2 [Sphaerodactylus townsendi]|uniref:membrane-spanning 4-domains subfamily A member 15-like isoform X2 n=1 Tax=Sphaerodactylus townsendi TaxID=933632 RepID=UPI002025C33C|nr:membrane-spanning 4-domains subfamily A member 15-like isoform X2 [Sphaerodactylus townsendi]XP_048357037.1 membrane-spanning 4-domains subfamily A member 15-like isoform X2 [Sphaerodactylus townsendi]